MTQNEKLKQLVISCRDIIDEVVYLLPLIETARILDTNELSASILKEYQKRLEQLNQEYKDLDFS